MAKPNIARRLGAFYGLEEDGEGAGAVEATETPIAEEVSAPVADVAEAAAEVDQQEEVLADMTEAAGEVENVETAADAAIAESADGTLSRESAAWVRIALENAIGKTGLVPAIMPSLEAFGGTSGRRSATKVTMEGIGEFLKKIWNAIKTQIQKVWAYVKNWYLKVLDAAPRLKKKAEAISKRTENMTGAPEAKDFELGVLKQLHLSGKAPKEGEIVTKMKLVTEKMEAALGSKTSSSYEKAFEDAEKLAQKVADKPLTSAGTESRKLRVGFEGIYGYALSLESTTGDNADDEYLKSLAAEELATALEEAYAEAAARATGQTPDKVPNERFGKDTDADACAELPGGKAVFEIGPKKGATLNPLTKARMCRPRLDNLLEKPKDVDSSGTFKTLSSSQVTDICSAVEDICDHIIEYKKAWEKRDKYTAKLKTTMDKIVSSVEKERADGEAEEALLKNKTKTIREVAKVQQAQWSGGTSYETAMVNYGLSVSRACLSWCEASISEYKG